MTGNAELSGVALYDAMEIIASGMTARERRAFWRGFDERREMMAAGEAVEQQTIFKEEK